MRCSVGKILRPPVLTRSVGAIPEAKSDGVGKGARGRRILPSAVPGAFAHLTRCGNVQRVMRMAPEKHAAHPISRIDAPVVARDSRSRWACWASLRGYL